MISPPTHIEAHVGNVSGGSQVAVGNYIVQIGRVEGGVVNILNEAPPPPRLRPQPVLLRPKPFPNLLDRETETTTLIDALKSQQTVECTGIPGTGKTSLLRHLAHQSQLAAVFPAGIVYFEVSRQSAADLLKSIFDAFYICDFPIKPNETEIRHYLQPVSALILLDDVEIDAKQIQSLMNVAPNCTFVAVTRERILLGEAVDVTLKGLPTADAVRLFRNELRRTLSAEEEKGAQSICESVECIPLLVLRAAHEARAQNRSLGDVVSESAPGDQRLAASEINSSSEDEKKVLAALAVFAGAPVAAEHVAAVAGITNIEPLLEDLERRGLVQSHEQRYTLASDVKAQQLGDLKPWSARAVSHLVDWTKERRNQHKLIAGSAAAILLILKQAVAAQAWNEVRNLGHAAEEALAVSGQWDMWATVLNSINTAARAQSDIAEQAWALHQLGTRALLLGDRAEAKSSLTDALDIRERLNDVSGAAVTRHNLDILLGPLPPEPQNDNGSGDGVEPGPAWLKIGIMSLIGVAIVVLLIRYFRNPTPQPLVVPPKIASFSVSPSAIPVNGQAQLCYEVENADSVRIEPNIGERKPASKECLSVTPGETLTYTLTAFAADGKSASRQITLNVESPPLKHARILFFEVLSPRIKRGESLRLCYGVADANTTTISPLRREFPSVAKHCFEDAPSEPITYVLKATGEDSQTESRELRVVVEEPVEPVTPPVRITRFEMNQTTVAGPQLCYALENARSARIEPRIGELKNLTADCPQLPSRRQQTYTLTAIGEDGKTATGQVTYTPPQPQLPAMKISSFTPLRQVIKQGGRARICYRTTLGEGTAHISPQPGSVPPAVLNTNCVTVAPQQTTEYTLTVGRGNEKDSRKVTVIVDKGGPVIF